jgi:hypothetical protein
MGEGFAASREARLAWSSARLGIAVNSFRQLTRDQAHRLIDEMQMMIPEELLRRRRRPGRDEARTIGRAGKRVSGIMVSAGATPPNAEGLKMLQAVLENLRWTEQDLARFLSSRTSPLRGRQQIRTLDDLNKVLFALRKIERRKKKKNDICHVS